MNVIKQYTKIQFHLRENTQHLCYEVSLILFKEHTIIHCENYKNT